MRILHISDMHLAPWQELRSQWVSALKDCEPDLVVVTGDSIGHKDGLDMVKKTLGVFKGIPGVFVFGSNDYHAPEFKNPLSYFRGPSKIKRQPQLLDVESQRRFLTEELKWIDLNNDAAVLRITQRNVLFVGVDDPHHKLDDITTTQKIARKIKKTHPRIDMTIGVSHAPYRRVLDFFVQEGAELIFTGHTHGGQICTPWFTPIVTNCDIPRSQARGYSRWKSQDKSAGLCVSAGVGTSIYAPVRLFCRPEASLITLNTQT
jgi:predicted MPP superfamily phosphohydrolase